MKARRQLLLAVSLPIAVGLAIFVESAQVDPDPSRRVYPLSKLQKASVHLGKHSVAVWLMDSEGKRAEGMMYLKSSTIGKGQGMLFVFPESRVLSFWNQNVHFNLDVAYLDGKGTVIAAVVLKAHDATPKSSGRPALYALEMRQGEFRRIGIKAGVKFRLPRGLAAK